MTRVYIAGPMSDLPRFNFPAFDVAAQDLREQGYDVVSPAELDSAEFRHAALNAKGNESDLLQAWGPTLARDVKLITDDGIEMIVLLPGWENSRGARLEAMVGLLNNLKFAEYRMWTRPVDIPPVAVLRGIERGFAHQWGARI